MFLLPVVSCRQRVTDASQAALSSVAPVFVVVRQTFDAPISCSSQYTVTSSLQGNLLTLLDIFPIQQMKFEPDGNVTSFGELDAVYTYSNVLES